MPQPPQFELSDWVSTQAFAQRVKPALQVMAQPLAVQVAVPFASVGQAFPQAPQFLVSLARSTH
jgi:hypothetical protein